MLDELYDFLRWRTRNMGLSRDARIKWMTDYFTLLYASHYRTQSPSGTYRDQMFLSKVTRKLDSMHGIVLTVDVAELSVLERVFNSIKNLLRIAIHSSTPTELLEFLAQRNVYHQELITWAKKEGYNVY